MINKEQILKNYSGSSPIFPLPNFVMFPSTGNEFTIFEPRYIDMMNFVMDNEKFITMALLKPGFEEDYKNSPPIFNIGTLGYISDFQVLSENKYKIILMGIDKVQINETEQTHSYRIGATTSLNEITTTSAEAEKYKNLLDRFIKLVQDYDESFPLEMFSEVNMSLEMVVNLISMSMPIPIEEKQKLLELPEIGLRYEVLIQFIDGEIELNRDITDIIPILPFDNSIN